MNQSGKTKIQGGQFQSNSQETKRPYMAQGSQNKKSKAKDFIWMVIIIAITIALTIFFMKQCDNNEHSIQPNSDSTYKPHDNNSDSDRQTNQSESQGIKKGEEFIAKKKQEDPNIKTSATGLSYKIEKEGVGAKASNEDIVKVKYKGSLIDGTVFDDSKGEALQFPVSAVIPGFAEGIKSLGTGGKATLYIPGNLAYGIDGVPSVGIGPDEMLIFEIELVEIIGVTTTNTSSTPATTETTSQSSTDNSSFTSLDLTFFELKGPVKSVSCNYYESRAGFKKSFSFTSNGQLNAPNGTKIKRNNGIISSISYYDSVLASWMQERFTTSPDGNVLSESGQGIDGGGTSNYSYNSKGHISKNTYYGSIEGETYNFVATYSYKSFDQYGNWTKRIVTSKDSYGTESMTETRTITYY